MPKITDPEIVRGLANRKKGKTGKQSKYRSVKTGQFDSKAEAKRFDELRFREIAGEISALKIHPKFELQPSFRDKHGKLHRAITYSADFEYIENGERVCEDVKGFFVEVFKIKEKLLRFKYPEIELRILKR
jgi:hypothetical protein